MKILLFASILLFTSNAFADKTNFAKITLVNYNADIDFLYFKTDGNWIVTDNSNQQTCTPTYIQVRSTVPGKQQLLSIGLSAKHAGSLVQFHGSCDVNNNNYFNATYIIID